MAMLCELIDIEKEMIPIFNGNFITADINEDAAYDDMFAFDWDNLDSINANGNIITDAGTSGRRWERDYYVKLLYESANRQIH